MITIITNNCDSQVIVTITQLHSDVYSVSPKSQNPAIQGINTLWKILECLKCMGYLDGWESINLWWPFNRWFVTATKVPWCHHYNIELSCHEVFHVCTHIVMPTLQTLCISFYPSTRQRACRQVTSLYW